MMNKPQMPGAAQRTVLQKPERGQGATARAAALSARASEVIRGPRRPRNGAPATGQAQPAPQQPALPPRLQNAIAAGRMSEDQARQRAMVNAPQYRAAMNAAGGAGMPAQARDWSAPTGDQSYGGSNGGGKPMLNGPPMSGQVQISDALRMGMGGANGGFGQAGGTVNMSGGGLQGPPPPMQLQTLDPSQAGATGMPDIRGGDPAGAPPMPNMGPGGGMARMNGGGLQGQPSPLASAFLPQGQAGINLEQLRGMISRYQGPQAQMSAPSSYSY